MTQNLEIRGKLLAKNTVLNFFGQIIPLFVALFTIPYIIHGLGTERFGILSLAWVVIGYFSILDLGLGRATTKFVAEALGRKEIDKISEIVGTSLMFIIALGLVGMATLILLTPLLVEHVLNVPSYLIEETKKVFYIISVSIVITLITATLSGVLEAYQRFDLVNLLRVPSNILAYVIPCVALFFGSDLPTIVLLLLLKNLCILTFYIFLSLKVMPSISLFSKANLKIASLLFSFGSWIALHNVAVAVLLYLDRFLVGVFLTMSAVTYYAVAYELVGRTAIIPSSMMMVLFPAFSFIEAAEKEKLQDLVKRAFKYLVLIMGLITGTIFVFSREILLFWLGNEFATKSTFVLQIFSIGVFLSSLAWLSGTILQGIGKPRVVTIITLFQVPIYIVLTWLLIKGMDIEGAAIAWTLQKGLIAVILYKACSELDLFKLSWIIEKSLLKFVVTILIIFTVLLIVKSSFYSSPLVNAILSFGAIMAYFLSVWRCIDDKDKKVILKTSKALLNSCLHQTRLGRIYEGGKTENTK